jgi:CelD/BcsL family acetyltransferase involved in cellulose biosynthesis
MTVTVRTIVERRALDAIDAEWDALAVAAGRPYSAPAWMLAWWEHVRPTGAELSTVTVHDGDRLVGLAPFYAHGSRYRLLGAEVASNVEPLAAPGSQRAVVEAVAAELADAEPAARTIDLQLQDESPGWATLLRDAWPSGSEPWHGAGASVAAPFVEIEAGADFESWLKGKSSKFRYWVRQGRRKLEGARAEFRLSTAETLEHDVRRLLALHRLRHEEAGSVLLGGDGLERMLLAAGAELLPAGRFRLVCLDIDGQVASAQLMLIAGGEAAGWNGGFDPIYAKLSPAMHTVIHGLGVAMEDGCRRLDLGPGPQPYKYRLADGERQLASSVLVPRGSGYALTRLKLASRAAPAALHSRLPARVRQGLRKGVARGVPASALIPAGPLL